MTMSRQKGLTLTSSLAVLALLAGGCANQTTAYRTQRLGDSPMVITTDAYQRHLLMIPDGAGQWRTCAEAAPDVFSAMSGSGGGDLGFNSSGPGTEAQARASMAVAQSAATAERTQTINLLRESMFRTCERYVNGGIDRATLVVQAGRDWRAMIAILAIEQLTQTGRPASTVISGPATTASVLGGEDARRELEEARGRLTTAQQHKREAEALPCEASDGGDETGTADAANGNTGGAGDDTSNDSSSADGDSGGDDGNAAAQGDAGTNPAGGADTQNSSADGDAPAQGSAANNPAGGADTQNSSTDDAANTTACTTRQERLDAANSEIEDAQNDIDEAQEKLNQAARSSAATSAGHMNAVGSGRSLTPAALRIVAPIVAGIVKQAFDTDETQLFCLQIMSRPDEPQGVDRPATEGGTTVRQMCIQYLAARVQNEIQTLVGWQVSDIAHAQLDTQIQAIEANLARGPGTRGERWNQLVAPIQPHFLVPLSVPADANRDQIRAKMRLIGSALQGLVTASQ